MTNTNWRSEFDNFIKSDNEILEKRYGVTMDYSKLKDFIQSTLDTALKDQKDELLEKMPKSNTFPDGQILNEYELGRKDGWNDCLNNCLEIIKGLIKGDV